MAVLRFVDSIQASPTVRLNLNDLTVWGMGAETSFGIPPMRRSVSGSLMRNDDFVGGSSYGNREIDLVLELRSTGDAAATQLQALQRELDRPMNLLQYTPGGTTNTVFFRTFRTAPESVRWDITRKQVRVTLLAESMALGIREDIASVTVRNDPTLTNGLFMDITGIKGDVETPLFIEYTRGATYFQRGLAVGVRPKGAAGAYPTIFRQAESLTMGTDTTAGADATMSGGNRARCTFATATMQTRVSGKFPQSTEPAGAECLGAYRVFARVARTVAGSVINVRVGESLDSGANVVYERAVALPVAASTSPSLMDLGVISIGDVFPASPGYDTVAYRAETLPTLLIEAERVSGTGSLDIDYVCLVPADYRYGTWGQVSTTLDASARAVVDGVNEVTYGGKAMTGATPGVFAETSVTGLAGGYPTVMPGDNRLVIVDPDYSNDLTVTNAVVLRYWPKYLLVRPVGT